MADPASSLASWESFYVIVGSSAAALTGLMFVVITLIAADNGSRTGGEIGAFGTPTVVHLCAALFISATISAPWQSLASCGVVIGALGVIGVLYMVLVFQRARRQSGYKPVWEDWLWHTLLPFIAYLAFAIDGFRLAHQPVGTLFATGAGTLLLVFIGIHNAWDTVTYLAIDRRKELEQSRRSPAA